MLLLGTWQGCIGKILPFYHEIVKIQLLKIISIYKFGFKIVSLYSCRDWESCAIL